MEHKDSESKQQIFDLLNIVIAHQAYIKRMHVEFTHYIYDTVANDEIKLKHLLEFRKKYLEHKKLIENLYVEKFFE